MLKSLEENILDKIDDTYKKNIEFNTSKETFAKAINLCLDKILASVSSKVNDNFKKIYSVSWANFQKV